MNISGLPLFDINLIAKILILLFIGLFAIFAFITYNNIRSLTKLLVIKRKLGSPLLSGASLIFLLLTISLFIAALVIL